MRSHIDRNYSSLYYIFVRKLDIFLKYLDDNDNQFQKEGEEMTANIPPIDEETLESLHLVRSWLHTAHSGTLATLSRKPMIQGFPLGSIVPFCLDSVGRPVILIAGIAAHTRNLKEDSRATLFVSDPAAKGDPQASWRASLVGRFVELTTSSEPEAHQENISEEELAIIHSKYIERVPPAESYFTTHNFTFWRLSEILTIRYIAGFGRIRWLAGESYSQAMSDYSFPDMEKGALQHMNEDHEHNLIEMVRGYYEVTPTAAKMISLDVDGFCVQTNEPAGMFSFSFEKLIEERSQYKTSIIRLLVKARKMGKEE